MTMPTPLPQKVGLTLAAIQLFFTLTWTVYVIFLPQLAAQVGIAKEAVLLILLMDQLIFLVADTAMGGRLTTLFGRLGRWVVSVTLLSCFAFLLLPFVATDGPSAQWLFLAGLSFFGMGVAGAMAPYLANRSAWSWWPRSLAAWAAG